MMKIYEEEMYLFAAALIESVGKRLKYEREHSKLEISQKTFHGDIVTCQDVLVEKLLTDEIMEKYPAHSILAEESHKPGQYREEDYTWIIDPIDGTINYCHFAKDYAISLALYRNNKPIFGFIYDVDNEIIYSGTKAGNFIINGNKFERVSGTTDSLQKSIVSMSFNTIKELALKGMNVFDFLSHVRGYRYMGCASLELCRVAKGEYDMYISSNVYIWDIAAARIFLESCGGVLIIRSKEKSIYDGKLFIGAFHSISLWEETLKYVPYNIKQDFNLDKIVNH